MSSAGARGTWLLLPALLLVLLIPPPLPPMSPDGAPSPAAAAEPLPVSGRVDRLSGDQLPGPDHRAVPRPAPGRRVVAVAGTLPAGGLPLWRAPLPHGRLLGQARTDGRGRFHLRLPPGVATLLIDVPGGFWLNSFDGRGDFSSVTVRPGLEPLRLLDDRGALQ